MRSCFGTAAPWAMDFTATAGVGETLVTTAGVSLTPTGDCSGVGGNNGCTEVAMGWFAGGCRRWEEKYNPPLRPIVNRPTQIASVLQVPSSNRIGWQRCRQLRTGLGAGVSGALSFCGSRFSGAVLAGGGGVLGCSA